MEKENYIDIRKRFTKMDTPRLEREVGIFFKKRYEEHNVECFEEHRIASSVLIRRQRDKTGPTFHMQNLVV